MDLVVCKQVNMGVSTTKIAGGAQSMKAWCEAKWEVFSQSILNCNGRHERDKKSKRAMIWKRGEGRLGGQEAKRPRGCL